MRRQTRTKSHNSDISESESESESSLLPNRIVHTRNSTWCNWCRIIKNINNINIYTISKNKGAAKAWDGGSGGVIAYLYICTYVCMYVCVSVVCECEGLESRLAWHHNLGVMETIRSQINNNRCLWGVGGGGNARASFSRGIVVFQQWPWPRQVPDRGGGER